VSTIEKPSTTAAPYLAAVAEALAGLREAERQELLDDLAEHLAELASDEDAAERLGTPAAYAAEFVASAGIEVPAPAPSRPPTLTGRLATAGDRFRRSPVTAAVHAFLPELRPGWWVLRAWAGLAILAAVASDDRSIFPIPDPVGNGFVALVALAAAVVGSVHVGRHGGGGGDRVLTALGMVGVAIALTQGGNHVEYVYDGGFGHDDGSLVGPQGQYIQNIWPYDGEGNPLEGVLLFDQDGNPISVGDQGATSGVVIPGLFPQAQTTYEYDPVTGAERQAPATAPVVQVPQLPGTSTTSTSTTTTSTTAPPVDTTLPPETTVPA
jgi:hypothetical protein